MKGEDEESSSDDTDDKWDEEDVGEHLNNGEEEKQYTEGLTKGEAYGEPGGEIFGREASTEAVREFEGRRTTERKSDKH